MSPSTAAERTCISGLSASAPIQLLYVYLCAWRLQHQTHFDRRQIVVIREQADRRSAPLKFVRGGNAKQLGRGPGCNEFPRPDGLATRVRHWHSGCTGTGTDIPVAIV